MRMSQIALYMQMSGAVTGRGAGLRWLKLPRKRPCLPSMMPGLRYLSRGELRIASTAVRGRAGRKPGGVNASAGSAC